MMVELNVEKNATTLPLRAIDHCYKSVIPDVKRCKCSLQGTTEVSD